MRGYFILLLLILRAYLLYAQSGIIESFSVPEAQQGVAVSKDHFYVINNTGITKHTRSDGTMTARWDDESGKIKHMNSGIVIEGRLYCSHSNFPDSPMASSIEIFDIQTCDHIASQSLGIMTGSATWIDKYKDSWYIAFAHYSHTGSSENKGPEWSQIVRFDDNWIKREAWLFPKEVIERMKPYSTSGGCWNNNGSLLITGHDKKELYIMSLPDRGYTLELIDILSIPIPGQGIAFDHWENNTLWGIDRKDNKVLKVTID